MGPKYGKHVKHIAGALANIDGTHIVEILHSGKEYYLDIDGSSFKITEEDIAISIKDREGFTFESNKELFVALDTELTPELVEEGFARELVNKIQFTRKDKKFEIMDKIHLFYSGDAEIEKVFKVYEDYIKAETLTETITKVADISDDMTKWDINGKEVYFGVNNLEY